MKTILKYFPHLSAEQERQFADLYDLYADWNQKVNVVSRKDIEHLYEHHVLHSLSISFGLHPTSGTNILDFGTGGGFPGIPLAILWPDCAFHSAASGKTNTKIRGNTEFRKSYKPVKLLRCTACFIKKNTKILAGGANGRKNKSKPEPFDVTFV